jgi:tetratricopeptide (TPR) repeat protein
VGPNGALYENMAHTYNSTGDYDNAEKYFNLAMELVTDKSKKGGILLGIGLVKERRGDPRKALPHLKKALKLYQVLSPESPNNGRGLALLPRGPSLNPAP